MAGKDYITSLSTAPRREQDLPHRQSSSFERQGRGWQVFDHPVELEPLLAPAAAVQVPPPAPCDDARRPTLITALLGRMRSRSDHIVTEVPSTRRAAEAAPQPRREDVSGGPLSEFQVFLPAKLKVLPETAEQFLLSLSYAAHPISFEIIGLPGSIFVQFACQGPDRMQLGRQLRSHFPEAVVSEESGLLEGHWNEHPGRATVIADFGLSQAFVLPLRAAGGFEPDPLVAIAGALTALDVGELGCLQVLFQAAKQPWAERAMRLLTDSSGKSRSAHHPDLLQQAKRKISRPLFAGLVRLAGRGNTEERAWRIVRALGAGLSQFTNPLGNSLIPLSNDGYARSAHERCLLSRQTFRPGMLLNSEELVSLAHPPSLSVRVEELRRVGKKTKAAPRITTGHRLFLGENRHGGTVREVSLSPEQRSKHLYLIGASGTGKSTLLLSLITQDIEQGQGLAVFDPHGDLIDHILARIPEHRHKDVILLDPSDEEYSIGFNILSAHSELEKALLASDLVAVFRRLSTNWGDVMNSVLAQAVLAFLESEQGGTLADLRRFLVDSEFRQRFLDTVLDEECVFYWTKEFPLLSGRPQAPLLTRLDTFLRPKPVRHMVTQKENKLDFAGIMNTGKIFLAKLSQGAIGEENSYLLGSLLVSKFHQMALSRQEMLESERRPFYLYCDEFQNFITPSMSAILSGARKYRLGLVLAHQELRQLLAKDTEVASAVITNPFTRICFRLGDQDAQQLAAGFSSFDAADLQNLGVGEAICRVERGDYDFNLRTLPQPPVDDALARERRERIRALSRQKYARRRAEVETDLAGERAVAAPSPPAEPVRKARTMAGQTSPDTASSALPMPPDPPVPELPERQVEPVAKNKIAAAPKALGRGGQQHQYLQQLFKRYGEEQGFKATIEKQIPGGSVDVALERDGLSIAVEISVTTTTEHEVGNIEKCLNAGFEQVVVVAAGKKALGKIKNAATAKLGAEDLAKVRFCAPEDLCLYLDELGAGQRSEENTVKGWKVKLTYKPLTLEEQEARRQAIAQTVLQALRRLKEPQ